MLGAGIYALMGVLSGKVGGLLWAPLVLALLLALLTAGSYAELVTKYPRAGGAAVFAERAFHSPLVSFLVGFSMLAAGVTSAAGLSIAFAGDYLGTFVDLPTTPVAIAFLALVGLLNARGIRESMGANLVMTAIELSGLVIVIVVVAVFVGGGGGDVSRAMAAPEGSNVALAVLSGAVIAYYSFVGFETSANMIEEVKDPRRTYPRALFGALLTAGVVYVLVGLASAVALPSSELQESSGPLLAVVEATGVSVPSWLFSLIALIAVANGALLTMIMVSRLTYGMAEQNLLPSVLGRVLPGPPGPVQAFLDHGEDFVVRDTLDELVAGMNELAGPGAPQLDPSRVRACVRARDEQIGSDDPSDEQVAGIARAREYLGDRLIRTAAPHRLLDPKAGRLVFAPGPDADHPPVRSTSGLLLGLDGDHLRVIHVMRNSPAAETGWKAGDTICAIDDKPIPTDYPDNALSSWSVGTPGRTVALKLCDGATRKLTLRQFY